MNRLSTTRQSSSLVETSQQYKYIAHIINRHEMVHEKHKTLTKKLVTV